MKDKETKIMHNYYKNYQTKLTFMYTNILTKINKIVQLNLELRRRYDFYQHDDYHYVPY